MAKKSTTQKAASSDFKKGQMTLWLSIGFFALVIMSLPTVVVMLFGLLPTFVTLIIDRSPQKHAAFCIGGINFSGVFPYMMALWLGDNTLDAAIMTITDVFALVVMYGAAALGWMLYQSLPPVVAAILTVIAQHKVSALRTAQRKLIKDWGEDVAVPQEVLNMRLDLEAANDDTSDGENVDMADLDVGSLMEDTETDVNVSTPPTNGEVASANGAANGTTANGTTANGASAAASVPPGNGVVSTAGS